MSPLVKLNKCNKELQHIFIYMLTIFILLQKKTYLILNMSSIFI